VRAFFAPCVWFWALLAAQTDADGCGCGCGSFSIMILNYMFISKIIENVTCKTDN